MTAGSEGKWGAYVCFGRAMGNEPAMPTVPGGLTGGPTGGTPTTATTANWTDVHGAGAQRSDPKDGDASVYALGNGPQGDAVRTHNYVRLVRNK